MPHPVPPASSTPPTPAPTRSSSVGPDSQPSRSASSSALPASSSERLSPAEQAARAGLSPYDYMFRVFRRRMNTVPPTPPQMLSGRVLSVTFTIPQRLYKGDDGAWALGPRSHRTATHHALDYLSSPASPWKHHVVAWTGELGTPRPEETFGESLDDEPSCCRASPGPAPCHAPDDNGNGRGDCGRGDCGRGDSGRADSGRADSGRADSGRLVDWREMKQIEHVLKTDTTPTTPVWLFKCGEVADRGLALASQHRWRAFAERDIRSLFHWPNYPHTAAMGDVDVWSAALLMTYDFAERVLGLYEPGDLVVVHDVELAMLPLMLRRRQPGMSIAYVVDAPFPTMDMVRCLPRKEHMLESMLAADLVGFPSPSYAREFHAVCASVWGLASAGSDVVAADGCRARVGVFPAGVHEPQVAAVAFGQHVDDRCADLRACFAGRAIIYACDRVDARGAARDHKLAGLHLFLEDHPEWRDRVVLIQSRRTGGPAMMDSEVLYHDESCNRRHGMRHLLRDPHTGTAPRGPMVYHLYDLTGVDHYALLRLADVALVTAEGDNMSATASEYVLCQGGAAGQLILPETSGMACLLPEALLVIPCRPSDIAHQLYMALSETTRDLRRARNAVLTERVKLCTAPKWTETILQQLVQTATDLRGPPVVTTLP